MMLSFLVFPKIRSLLMHTRQMQSQCAGGTDHCYSLWEDQNHTELSGLDIPLTSPTEHIWWV